MAGPRTAGSIVVKFVAGNSQFNVDVEKSKAKVVDFAQAGGAHMKQFGGHSAASVAAASGAIREFEGKLPIRAVERFLASTLKLGVVLQNAFPIIGGIAFGEMLIETTEKALEFFKAMQLGPEKARAAFRELLTPLRLTNDELRIANDRLEQDIAKLEGKRQNTLKLALDEARQAADKLAESLEKDLAALHNVLEQQGVSRLKQVVTLGESGANTQDILEFLGETPFRGVRGKSTDATEAGRAQIVSIEQQGRAKVEAAKTPEARKLAEEDVRKRVKEAQKALDDKLRDIYDSAIKQLETWLVEAQKLSQRHGERRTITTVNPITGIEETHDLAPLVVEGTNQVKRIEALRGALSTIKEKRDVLALTSTKSDLTEKKEGLEAANANKDLRAPLEDKLTALRAQLAGAKEKLGVAELPESARMLAAADAEALKDIAEVNKALEHRHALLATTAEQDMFKSLRRQTAATDAEAQWRTKLQATTAGIEEQIRAQEALTAAIGKGYETVKAASIETQVAKTIGPERYLDPDYMREHADDVTKLRSGITREYEARHTGDVTGAIDKLQTQIEMERNLAAAQQQGAEAVRLVTLAYRLRELTMAGATREQIRAEMELYNAQRQNVSTANIAKLSQQTDEVKKLTAALFEGAEAERQAANENKYAEMKRGGASPQEIQQQRGLDQAERQREITAEALKTGAAYQEQAKDISRQLAILDAVKGTERDTLEVQLSRRNLENERLKVLAAEVLQLKTARAGIDAFFIEMSQDAKSAADIIYDALHSAFQRATDELAKLLTGQKTSWGRLLQEIGQSMMRDVLQSVIQRGLKQLGKVILGVDLSKKTGPDGSAANPFWVKILSDLKPPAAAGQETPPTPGTEKTPEGGGRNVLIRILRDIFHVGAGPAAREAPPKGMGTNPLETMHVTVDPTPGRPDGSSANPYFVFVQNVAALRTPTPTQSTAPPASSVPVPSGTQAPPLFFPLEHREMGGPVHSGRTYMVGERGPEILKMGHAGGTVMNNSEVREITEGWSNAFDDQPARAAADGAFDMREQPWLDALLGRKAGETEDVVKGNLKGVSNFLSGLLNITPAGLMYSALAGHPGLPALEPSNRTQARTMKAGEQASEMMQVGMTLHLPGSVNLTPATIGKVAPIKKAAAYQFFSPNVEENLALPQATKRLGSADQKRMLNISRDVDRAMGIRSEPKSALGDWSDGAENAIFNELGGQPSLDDVRYSAAIKGQAANQKAVIPFLVRKGGPDSLYRVQFTTGISETRSILDASGIQQRTLIPGKGGTDVVVFDPGSALKGQITTLSEGEHAGSIKAITVDRGVGEFLGGDTRIEGSRAYRRVIGEYEAAHPDRRYDRGARGPGLRGSERGAGSAEAVTPLTAERVFAEARNPKGQTYADWLKHNPDAGEGLFLTNPGPADPVQASVERYAPPQGTSARVSGALENPDVVKRLRSWAKAGQEKIPGNWYDTSQIRRVYEGVLGKDKGRESFRQLMREVSATSPRSAVPDNIRTASYYNYLEAQGLPIPDKPASGYGSLVQRLHRANAVSIREAGSIDPLTKPKAYSFAENLSGNYAPVTIDTHNFRALGIASRDPRFLETRIEVERLDSAGKKVKEIFNPRKAYESGELTMDEAVQNSSYWASAPEQNEHAAYEGFQQKLAKRMGMTPAEFQGALWVGAGEHTGLASPPVPFAQVFAARIQYTANRLGVSPQQVLTQLIKGQIPLLADGGDVAPGKPVVVGEKGREAFMPFGAGLDMSALFGSSGEPQAVSRTTHTPVFLRDAAPRQTVGEFRPSRGIDLSPQRDSASTLRTLVHEETHAAVDSLGEQGQRALLGRALGQGHAEDLEKHFPSLNPYYGGGATNIPTELLARLVVGDRNSYLDMGLRDAEPTRQQLAADPGLEHASGPVLTRKLLTEAAQSHPELAKKLTKLRTLSDKATAARPGSLLDDVYAPWFGPGSMTDKYGALTARANGGPLRSGQLTVVGEKGPELFIPEKPGSIIPNHMLRGMRHAEGGAYDPAMIEALLDAVGTAAREQRGSGQGKQRGGDMFFRIASAAPAILKRLMTRPSMVIKDTWGKPNISLPTGSTGSVGTGGGATSTVAGPLPIGQQLGTQPNPMWVRWGSSVPGAEGPGTEARKNQIDVARDAQAGNTPQNPIYVFVTNQQQNGPPGPNALQDIGSTITGLANIGIASGGKPAGRATGGQVSPSEAYIVGERGPELLVGTAGRVLDNATSKRALGNGGAMTYIGNIDARGTDPVLTEQRVKKAMIMAHNSAIGTSVQVTVERGKRLPQRG